MSDNLRDRIAAVLEEHRQVASSCECGIDLGVSAITWRWRDHVADAVIAELGLRRASRPNDYDHRDYPPGDRYITDWITREPRSADKLGLTGDGQ